MSKTAGKAFDFKLVKRIYGLARPYKWIFFGGILATLLMAVLNPLRALLTQLMIDDYISKSDVEGLTRMTIFILILVVGTSIIQFLQAIIANYLGQEIISHLRVKVFKHISRYKLSKLDQTPVGTLVTRAISDLETLADVFSEGLVSIAGDLLQIIFIVLLMVWQNWKLTLVCLSILPLLIYAGYIFKNAVKASFTDTRNQVTRLNTFVQEHIQGMLIIQLFNRQKKEYEKFEHINRVHRDANNRGVKAYAIFFPAVEFITAISTALIVWYGVGQIIERHTGASLGQLTAFLMLINMFFRPVRQLADRFNSLQMGMVAAERIFSLTDDQEAVENSGVLNLPEIQGSVCFKNVSFSYIKEQPILKNVSFEVTPGKTLALVGSTGAGKSTIINLISHFYSIDEGSITIDGIDVKNIQLNDLRKQVAVVMQEVFLFSGSILDNLVLYNSNIPFEKVVDVCKLTGIHNFITNLPNGYHQQVQERGVTLSSGQRQLISLSRTMLADPKILILDEATSSVDSYSEELIQKAIQLLMKGRTSIVIAHRLSTIQHADEIMVIDRGSIIEKGKHQELLNQQGMYKKLYEMQFEPLQPFQM